MERTQGAGDEPAGTAEAVAAIEGMFASFAMRDRDAFVEYLSEDGTFEPPAFLMGKRLHRGREEVRASFDEIERLFGTENRLRIWPKRYFADRANPGTLLALIGIDVTRPDGEGFGAEAAVQLKMRAGKVDSYRSRPDFEAACAELSDPVEVPV